MKGIFSVLVENKDGVLSGISGLFARRGYNIDSLAVGETDKHDVSSMTIVSTGDERTIDQIEKQLNKKPDVIKVRRLEESKAVELEMMMIKVSYSATNRASLIELCSVMGAKIMHVTMKYMIIELAKEPETLDESMWAAAAAVGLAGMVLAGSGLAAASESQPETADGKSRTVSASATGVVMEVPDMAQITFGIVTNGEKADAAQAENTEKVNQVIATLKGMGVEDKSIQTSGYSISPQYDYDNLDVNKQPKLTGYQVRTTLQVSDQKIADAGKILSESVKAGVNNVEGVVYTCSTYDEKYEEALQKAVKAARKKADVLAKAEGASAGKVVSISEGYQDLSARYQSSDIGAAYETADAVQNASSIPDLSAGTLQIQAEVSVTYELAY